MERSPDAKKSRLEGGTAQKMLEEQMRVRFMDPGAHLPKFRLFTGLQAVMEAELDDAGVMLGHPRAAVVLGALFSAMHAFATKFKLNQLQSAACGSSASKPVQVSVPVPALPECMSKGQGH